MNFKVNRNRWRTGSHSSVRTGVGQTKLLNGCGWMCCLGHCMISEGFTEEEIYSWEFPSEVEKISQTSKSVFNTSEEGQRLAIVATQINDTGITTREEKEKRLTELFKAYGHTIEFYDGESIC